MEESCLYSRHQERDSITGICLGVPQCVGNPLQTPTGRKTNRACVFHAVWTAWHSGFDTITLIHLEKAELTLFFFFFTLPVFIPQFYLPLNMRSSWCTQMDQPDGFLLTQWNSKTRPWVKISLSCLRFFMAWWQHLFSSPLVREEHSANLPTFKTKQDGTYKCIQRLNIPPWEPCEPIALRQ